MPFGTSGSAPPHVLNLASAEFNGDGKADLAVFNIQAANGVTSSVVTVLLGNGDGTFQVAGSTVVSAATSPALAGAVTVGDVNGDGKSDVITTSTNSASDRGVAVLLGNGDGTLKAPVRLSVGSSDFSPLRTVVGDFNGDGKQDLATVGTSPTASDSQQGVVSVLLGNGDGTFQAPAGYAAGSSPSPLAVGDFTGDGKPDLVAGNFGSLSVLLGKGDGTFQPAVASAVPGGGVASVAVGDVSGDGKPDLVAATGLTGGSPTAQTFLGNGDGTFRTPVGSSLGSPATAIALSDLDRDGKSDLVVLFVSNTHVGDIGGVVVSTDVGILGVLLGNGDGTFGSPINYSPVGEAALAVRDFNGDGIPDIASANGFGVWMLLNANQHATTTATSLAASPSQAVAGQPVTLTATVTPTAAGTGTPTGTVAFVQRTGSTFKATTFVNEQTIGTAAVDATGHADLTINFSPDSTGYFAVYRGDANFTPSTSPLASVSAGRVPTTTTVMTSPSPAVAGRPITVAVTVMFQVPVGSPVPDFSGPQAVVQLSVDGAFFNSTGLAIQGTTGVGTLTLPALSPGSHLLQATFPGSAAAADSSTNVMLVVGPAGSAAAGGATPGQRVVAQLYQDLLGRAAGPADLAFWAGLLDRGQSRTQVALGIEGSLEYRARVVSQLYTQLLKRPADAGGLQSGVNWLAQGGTQGQLDAILLGSDEYLQTRSQGTAAGFVQAVYQDVLQRSPSPGELQGWLQQFGAGLSRPTAALAILTSAEGETVEVQSLYQQILQRPADSAGLGFFAGALQGGATREQVAAVLAGSQEHFAAVNGPLHQRYVAQLYRDLLGREAGPADFAYWVGLLNQGLATPRQVVQQIEQSTEYLTRQVQTLFGTFLHRTPDAGGLQGFVAFLAGGGTLEQAALILTTSAEYFQSHGGSEGGFLQGLYQEALGRAPDAVAVAGFGPLVSQPAGRDQVAAAVFGSPEYRQDLVEQLFAKALHRTADPSGLASVTAALNQGVRDEQVLAVLASADEYFAGLP